MRDRCEVCGLDLRAHDAGDGAAVGVILVLGAVVVALAFWVEFRFSPPLWVHAVLWPVVTVPLAVLMMRPAKAALVALQYRHRSSEMGYDTGEHDRRRTHAAPTVRTMTVASLVMKSRLHRLLWPGVMATAMLVVLLGLGTWQVKRLHWKLDVLAQIARAEAAPAVPLPTEPDPFAKVQVTGHLRNDLAATYGADVRDTPSGPLLGTYLIVPLERPTAILSWWIAAGCRTSVRILSLASMAM